MRNHGLLTCGRTIPEAFINLWTLQRACEVQVATDSAGRGSIPVGDHILSKGEKLMAKQSSGNPTGELEFNAYVRLIEKADPSYKE